MLLRSINKRFFSSNHATPVNALISHLKLEQIEQNLFRGLSYDPGWGRVFGGQVLGQAIGAAQSTIPDENRSCHSLHSYFLRPGDVNAPIIYDVEIIRDGRSFSARRVKAIQHGKPIFFLTASFHEPEMDAFEHQELDESLKDVPSPEDCRPVWDLFDEFLSHVPKAMKKRMKVSFGPDSPIQIRPTSFQDPMNPTKNPPYSDIWIRSNGKIPADADASIHRALLAFASDYGLLEAALYPHAVSLWEPKQKVQCATIDHSMWFHHPLQFDEWILHRIHSPVASASRGLCFGELIQNGKLVASTAQQGLTRKVKIDGDKGFEPGTYR